MYDNFLINLAVHILKIGDVSVSEVATSLFLVAPFNGKSAQAVAVLNTHSLKNNFQL